MFIAQKLKYIFSNLTTYRVNILTNKSEKYHLLFKKKKKLRMCVASAAGRGTLIQRIFLGVSYSDQ